MKVSGDIAYYRDLMAADLHDHVSYRLVGSALEPRRLVHKVAERLATKLESGNLRSRLFEFSRERPVGSVGGCELVVTHICYVDRRKVGIPVIWSTQGLSPPDYYEKVGPVGFPDVLKFYESVSQKVSELVVWTESGAILLQENACLAAPVSVIPPVLPERTPSGELPSREVDVKVLFVGRDGPRKGLNELLGACRKIGSAVSGNTWAFDVVTLPTEGILSLASGLDNVFIRTDLSDQEITNLMVEADILVLPTKAETYGYVLVEAMSMGCALITSDLVPMNELVEEGVNGVLVNPDSEVDIAEKLAYLIGDSDLVETMKSASKKKYRESFSPGAVLAKYHELFHRVSQSTG